MRKADVPAEFYEGSIGTDDINVMPEQAAPVRQKIKQGLNDRLAQLSLKGCR